VRRLDALGVDSAFLRKENKVLQMNVKCAVCGEKINIFINDMASPGEVWPFCKKCNTYVDVAPGD
jgi:ribosomal protein L44E